VSHAQSDASLPRRLLVTGATGFIGWHVAVQARQLGYDVLATGRVAHATEAARGEELSSAGVRFEAGDLRDTELVERVLAGRDAVVHLAAAQHEAHMPHAYFHAVNVGATGLLLAAARACGVRRFVYGSTIGVYGDTADGITLDEESPPRPANVYTRTKLEAETLVRAHAAPMEACVVRISETYGPGDLRLLKLFRAIHRGQFVMLGEGRNRRRPVHVQDLARGLLLAASHPAARDETFVLAGPQTVSTDEFVALVAAALNREPPRVHLPLWPFVVAATVLEGVLRPLRIRPPLHRRRLDFFRTSFEFSTAKAQARLGYRPEIDLRSGIQDTLHWYCARGLLPASTPRQVPTPKPSG